MKTEELAEQYRKRASSELIAGASFDMNDRLPYISIKMSNNNEYFFQGEEAQEMIDEFEQSVVFQHLEYDEYFLAVAQNW